MKLEFELTEEQSKQVSEFWTTHGTSGASMLAQPVFSRSSVLRTIYILKIGIFNPMEAKQLSATLTAINNARGEI